MLRPLESKSEIRSVADLITKFDVPLVSVIPSINVFTICYQVTREDLALVDVPKMERQRVAYLDIQPR